MIIIDDASEDNTLSILRKETRNDKRFKIFSTDQYTNRKFRGPYYPRNIALKKLKESLYVFRYR